MIMKATIKISETDVTQAITQYVDQEIPPPSGYEWKITLEYGKYTAELSPLPITQKRN